MSKTKKAPARAKVPPAAEANTPLTLNESRGLNLLGWGKEHIAELTPERGREILAAKTLRPGSNAYLKKAINPLTGKPGIPLDSRFSDEAVSERAKSRPKPSGVVVELDEYTQKAIRGESAIDAVLLDLEERFPGQRFRAINPDLPPVAGPQFQPVYDDQGKEVTVADLKVGFMPESVYDEAYRKPNLERSRAMTGRIQSSPEDADLALKPQDRQYAPIAGRIKGPDGQTHATGELEIEKSEANYA